MVSMLKFEIKDREGLGRLGKLETKHGRITTPALLPVINPNQMLFTPKEMKEKFGTEMVITNSYIIKKSENLREKALSEGVHKLIDFEGPIMTDSGTFQSYVYGDIDVKPDEIITFQRDIGVDIGTALDVFTKPDISHAEAKEAIEETLRRVELSARLKGEMALACPVQGSVYPDLREYCASEYAKMGEKCDFFPIGGVVPLMEAYRYRDIAEIIIASKKGLDISKPVHLFGAGHPMLFAFAVLLGCDMFDSSSYVKFARDERMMFVDGTYNIADMTELPCSCPVCSKYKLEEIKKLDVKAREKVLAEHNLYVSFAEIRNVREAIRLGNLWELVERRVRAHPYLLDGFKVVKKYVSFLEEYEPISKKSAFFYTSGDSINRPIVYRYEKRLFERYRNPAKRVLIVFPEGNRPYGQTYRNEIEEISKVVDAHFVVSSIFGPVPIELGEMYPISQSVAISEENLDMNVKERMNELVKKYSHTFEYGLTLFWEGKETLDTLKEIGLDKTEDKEKRLNKEKEFDVKEVKEGEFDNHKESNHKGYNERYNKIEKYNKTDNKTERYNEIDIDRVRATADMQFGKGAGDVLLDGKVEFVKSATTHRIRNVIVDGEHVLSLRASDGLFTLKLAGARRLIKRFSKPKLRVIVDEDSAKYNMDGKNVFARFVKDADEMLRPGDEAIIVTENDEVVAIGKTLLNRREMFAFKNGIAVKVREGIKSKKCEDKDED